MVICRGCQKEIKTKVEKYTHVEDYNCERKENESWWHLACFGKAMNRELTQLERTAAVMLGKAAVMYNKLPEEFRPESEEVFTVK